MENILIRHPLRDIAYALKPIEKRSYVPSEEKTLQNYVTAHNTVWQMKMNFEKEKGEAMLASLELDQLIKNREDLADLYEFYKPDLHLSNGKPSRTLAVKLQVELRHFYHEVLEQQYAFVRFHDRVSTLERNYIEFINMYFTQAKPIDPLDFTVLDDIFINHNDRNINIVSLDKDLQSFLEKVDEVYELLDAYVEEYNWFYTSYFTELDIIEDLVKTVENLSPIWGSE